MALLMNLGMKYLEQRGRAILDLVSHAFAENSGTRAGRQYGISEKNHSGQAWLQRNLSLPCSMGLSSVEDRLGLAFFSCCASFDGPGS